MTKPIFIQAASQAAATTGLTQITVTTVNPTIAGNYLVIFVYGFAITGKITDNQGNTYSFNVVSNGGVAEYHINGCVGGPLTITYTFNSPPPGDVGIAVLEYDNGGIVNIADQLENVSPGGNALGEFSQCLSNVNDYVVTQGSGVNLSTTYSWPSSWSALTNFGPNAGSNPVYVPNTLIPPTLEGTIIGGVSGATQPAWVSGGVTIDATVEWQDSSITIPGMCCALLAVYGDLGGTWTLNGTGWTLRTSASGLANIAVYEHGPDPFFSTYPISIDKTADTFDLAAQLSQVTGPIPPTPPPTGLPVIIFINDKTLPVYSMPWPMSNCEDKCHYPLL